MNGCCLEGAERLVSSLDRAVQCDTVQEITGQVKDCLSRLISGGEVALPEEICRPLSDCYARRLVHRSHDWGYEVIAMIWGPGQRTPLHDHAGIWCVEGVFQGEIEVCQYDLVESSGDLFRFKPCNVAHAHLGESGSLIPPYEYHTIANPLPDQTSITIHVYGGGMEVCHAFIPMQDGWFRREQKRLQFHPLGSVKK